MLGTTNVERIFGGNVSNEFGWLMMTVEKRSFDSSNKAICYKIERPSGCQKAACCCNVYK